MDLKIKYTLQYLYSIHYINDAQYDLIHTIINHTATPYDSANLLLVSSSDATRVMWANAMIAAYEEKDNPVVLVQNHNHLHAKNALTFNYSDVDYPYCKLYEKIAGYQCIAADQPPLAPVAMQLLGVINLYPVSIVSITASSIPAAFNMLYRAHAPHAKDDKTVASTPVHSFINALFDYVFLAHDNFPLSAYALA